MPNVESRIPFKASKGASGALFGAALAAFAFRLYIQLRVVKSHRAEDWILLFAVISLISATVLYYVFLRYLYAGLDVINRGATSPFLMAYLADSPRVSKTANALDTLWWVVIFSVKLAYLAFFHKLIFRVRGLKIWWWIAVGFMVVAMIVCVITSWTSCHYFKDPEVFTKCTGPAFNRSTIDVTITTTVFDVLSDLIIVSIPVALLWKVRIAIRQKIALGVVLCLSVVMICVALVRIGGIRLPLGDLDIVWITFWQQQECNVAVAMVSMTAYRSFFTSQTPSHEDQPRHKYGLRQWLKYLKRSSGDKRDVEQVAVVISPAQRQSPLRSGPPARGAPEIATKDPAIPSATITGIGSMVEWSD